MYLNKLISKNPDLNKKSRRCMANQQSLNPYIIAKDDCCELGMWLYDEGKEHYGNLNSFSEIVHYHAEFHLEASKIAFATKKKSHLEIAAMMADGSIFSILVLKIARSIDQFKKEIENY